MNPRKALLFCAHGANDLYWFIYPIVLPRLMDKFGFLYADSGLILSIFYGFAGASSYFSGKISGIARIHKEVLAGLSFLVASSTLILSGGVGNSYLFFTILCITGIAVGIYHPIGYIYIEMLFSNEKKTMFAKYEVAGIVSIMTMLLINGYFINHIGLSGVLVVAALPGFAVGSFLLVSCKKIRKAISISIQTNREETRKSEVSDSPVTRRGHILFLLFLLSIFLRAFSSLGIVNFMTTYLAKELGAAESLSIYIPGTFFFGNMIGALILGRSLIKAEGFGMLQCAALLLMTAIIGISLTRNLFIIASLILILGFGMSLFVVSQNLLLTTFNSGFDKSERFGLLMAVGTFAYSFSPLTFGILADKLAPNVALRYFFIPVFLAFVIIFFVSLFSKKPPSSE